MIGRYSYAVYLWHMIVINWLSPVSVVGYSIVPIGSTAVRAVLVIVVSLAIAALSWRVLELPMQSRLFRGADRSPAAHSPNGSMPMEQPPKPAQPDVLGVTQ